MSKLQDIQGLLGVDKDGKCGPKTRDAFNALCAGVSAPAWPFTMEIVGDDIVVKNVVITCFGGWGTGIADTQDKGGTASGINTRDNVVEGVSIAMDGRQFSGLSAAEHKALDGAPIPRLLNARGLTAWHTPVEVTIDAMPGVHGITFIPKDGLVDLGPGLGASRPNEPHALDLTIPAAAFVEPGESYTRLTNNFERRGSFRIIGGAKLASVPAV